MMRCYWANDSEVGRYHVPGCMGAAVYGPHRCTCGPKQRRKELEEKVVDLEERLRKVEQELRADKRTAVEK